MPPMNPRPDENIPDFMSKLRPGMVFIIMIFCALIAFEIFNYTTTDHALADLLGDLTFMGIPWSTLLALAFCGIDFAGIARLFTPEQGVDEPKEVWYLFGAWLLAATMNAILTWWGVSMAVINHQAQSSSMIDPQTLSNVVPVFVAVMVWVIRILIIGTLSMSMDRMLHPDQPVRQQPLPIQSAMPPSIRRSPRTETQNRVENTTTVEPTYPYPASLGNNSYNQRPPASRAAASNRPSQSGRNAPSPRPSYSNPAADEGDDVFGDNTTARTRSDPTYHTLGGKKLS